MLLPSYVKNPSLYEISHGVRRSTIEAILYENVLKFKPWKQINFPRFEKIVRWSISIEYSNGRYGPLEGN